MLRSVSWLQFFSFLFIGILVYYGYFGWVYFGPGLLRFLKRDTAPIVPGAAPMIQEAVPREKVPANEQGEMGKRLETDKNASGKEKGEAKPDNKPIDTDKETKDADGETKAAAQLADMAIMHLKQVVDQSVASGEGWEDIIGRMGLVLEGCRKLRGTEYERTINSFIERNCRASFELVLGKEDLKRLWEDGQQEERLNGQQEQTVDEQQSKQ